MEGWEWGNYLGKWGVLVVSMWRAMLVLSRVWVGVSVIFFVASRVCADGRWA